MGSKLNIANEALEDAIEKFNHFNEVQEQDSPNPESWNAAFDDAFHAAGDAERKARGSKKAREGDILKKAEKYLERLEAVYTAKLESDTRARIQSDQIDNAVAMTQHVMLDTCKSPDTGRSRRSAVSISMLPPRRPSRLSAIRQNRRRLPHHRRLPDLE